MEDEQKIFLRPAVREDFPAIRALIHQVGINPTGLDWRRFVVAVTPQGKLAGCGQVKQHGRSARELASIAVIPEMRSRGVARAVIERLLAEHPGALFLFCRAGLGPFYQKFGFRLARPEEMPLYFRVAHRFAAGMQRLGMLGEGLLIMVRDSGEDGKNQNKMPRM